MTDQPEASPAGEAAPQHALALDSFSAHLMRRTKFFEDEALLLAMQLRDANAAGMNLSRTLQQIEQAPWPGQEIARKDIESLQDQLQRAQERIAELEGRGS